MSRHSSGNLGAQVGQMYAGEQIEPDILPGNYYTRTPAPGPSNLFARYTPPRSPSLQVGGNSGSVTASGGDPVGVGGQTGIGSWNVGAGGYLAPGVPSAFATAYPTSFTNLGNGQYAARAQPANMGNYAANQYGGGNASGGYQGVTDFAGSMGFASGGGGWLSHFMAPEHYQ